MQSDRSVPRHAASFRYESTPGGTPCREVEGAGESMKKWLILFAVATALGLLNFSVVLTSELAAQAELVARYPFVYEMTGAYTVLERFRECDLCHGR